MLVIFMALPERAMGDCDSFCRADGTCTSCQEVTPYPSYPTQQPTYNKPSYQPPPSQSYTPPSQTYTPPTRTYTPPTQTYTPPSQTYTPPTQTYTDRKSTRLNSSH